MRRFPPPPPPFPPRVVDDVSCLSRLANAFALGILSSTRNAEALLHSKESLFRFDDDDDDEDVDVIVGGGGDIIVVVVATADNISRLFISSSSLDILARFLR